MTSRQQRASRALTEPTSKHLEILADLAKFPQQVEHHGTRSKMLVLGLIEPTDAPRAFKDPVLYQITEAGRSFLPTRKPRPPATEDVAKTLLDLTSSLLAPGPAHALSVSLHAQVLEARAIAEAHLDAEGKARAR